MDVEDLKKYLEEKINSLKKEIETYEFLLDLISIHQDKQSKGEKGISYLKNKKGEIVADIIEGADFIRVVLRKPLNSSSKEARTLIRLLTELKEGENSVDFSLSTSKEEIREILIRGISSELILIKAKAALEAILIK